MRCLCLLQKCMCCSRYMVAVASDDMSFALHWLRYFYLLFELWLYTHWRAQFSRPSILLHSFRAREANEACADFFASNKFCRDKCSRKHFQVRLGVILYSHMLNFDTLHHIRTIHLSTGISVSINVRLLQYKDREAAP
jgi:hypothetical protein